MSLRDFSNPTPAEQASFDIVPETCPSIDKAFAEMEKCLTAEKIAEGLKARGIVPDPKLCRAIICLIGEYAGPQYIKLLNTVHMHGTYPLRLALVKQIEAAMPAGQPTSRYEDWIKVARPGFKLGEIGAPIEIS